MLAIVLTIVITACAVLALIGLIMSLRYRPAPEEVFHYVRHYARTPLTVPLRGKSWPIHYLEFGHPRHPMIILWHGVGSRAGQFLEFTHIAEALEEQGFYVVVPDLPGHGRTPAPRDPEDFGIEALAALMQEFTAAMLKQSKSPSCVWAAHSLSAAAALTWASSCAAVNVSPLPKLRGIATIGLPVARSIHWLIAGTALPGAPRLLPPVLYRLGRLYFTLYLSAITREPRLRRLLLELYYPRGPEAVYAQVQYIRKNRALITAPEGVFSRFTLHAPPTPIVFLHGSHDRMFPVSWVKQLVRAYLPDAPFVVWPGVGHNAVDDLPEEVTRAVTFFARGEFQRFTPQLARKASAYGLAASGKERHCKSSWPMVRTPRRASSSSWGKRFVSLGLALARGSGDLVEFLLAVALTGAPLLGLLALMGVMIATRSEIAAFSTWPYRDLLIVTLSSVPLLTNIPHLVQFLGERYRLRGAVAGFARIRAGRVQAEAMRQRIGWGSRIEGFLNDCIFTWKPGIVLALPTLLGGAIVQAIPTDKVRGFVGILFALMWICFAIWTFMVWSVFAGEPKDQRVRLENERRKLRTAKRPGQNPSAPPPPSVPPGPQKAPALPTPASRPAVSQGSATRPDDKMAKFLARAIYRELKQNGYTPQQVVAVAAALIELVQQDQAGQGDLAGQQPPAN